ncbi:partial heptose III glucuronosyltransferase, partial [Methylococcales bacterium]
MNDCLEYTPLTILAIQKVSIIIPAYNAANFIADAVGSALSQTYHNIEVIVVNDGSNDGGLTEAIAKSFGDSIRYFHKPNGGVASALNFGISKMQGDLFSWLSHDDIYTPDKIEREVAAFNDSGDQAIIYSDFFVLDKEGTQLYSHRLPSIPQGGMRCFLAESSSLHGCTLLI